MTARRRPGCCRCHDLPWTVCPACGCHYCAQAWPQGCPRLDWHPAHGTTAEDTGRRYQALADARQATTTDRRRAEQPAAGQAGPPAAHPTTTRPPDRRSHDR